MSIEAGDPASFSSSCSEVAKALVELADQSYDCLLIPCRGAFPVLVGAIEALKNVEGGKDVLERFCAPYSHPVLKE